MWSNVISIDKGFRREIEFILGKLKNIRHLSYAVEESRDRVFVYIASVCEMQEEVEAQVRDVLQTVFLVFLKLRFFLSSLQNMDLNHANCALICSLVHFDTEYEKNIIGRVLGETIDYAIDGLLNFRLRPLMENWEELAALATRLISSGSGGDIYDIASFITGTDGAKNRLALTRDALLNLTVRRPVEVIDLFDKPELNLISAIIREHPCEILLRGVSLSAPMNNTLKHIARVVVE
ncbi:MAG TPA: hypothetical protein IAD51_04595 [Candidatus Limadaptatus stercorigallinarum]|uniref:Uncharacterized protein n=1 Tax=Candidatus Limadaptatus stercorigallinarum TaxID=2840845 RepID=A0A9D1HT27_9FIRM|nr:hypothetical protein [Christensenellales bacterium]HIU21492.1 hypothetical protein [Candidatus Limadaptatus stercorigallinarum]